MTSEHTKGSTGGYFRKHNYFGLSPDNLVLFEQHMLPCLTFDGKIILEKPYKIARAPSKFIIFNLDRACIVFKTEIFGVERLSSYINVPIYSEKEEERKHKLYM